MKLHVGVDDQNGLVHSQATTSANMHGLTASEQLLHGEEVRVWGDAGYRGIEKRKAHKDRQVAWHIAMGPSQRRRLARDDLERLMEECESSVRAKVEQVFFYVKQMFDYGKVRYCSLMKPLKLAPSRPFQWLPTPAPDKGATKKGPPGRGNPCVISDPSCPDPEPG